MRLSLTGRGTPVALLTGVSVLVVGLADWLQGSPPDGIVDLPAGVALAVFATATIGAVLCSDAIATQGGGSRLQLVGVGLAAVAALIGDPTYAVLLLAIPLVDIARFSQDPRRQITVAAIFVLAIVLVALEQGQSWNGGDLEATLVLLIALLLTTMLGYALGRLDDARRSEAEVARVEEREHLASELHDSVGHSLLATSIQLRNATAIWEVDAEAARASVRLASQAVAEALADTRVAVDTIRSASGTFSLDQGLRALVDQISSPSLDVDLTIDTDMGRIDQVIQITLYRVAQEALSNVVRHSHASQATVRHTITPTDVRLEISDDGAGFNTNNDAVHVGLRSLAERLQRIGGSLAITSAAGSGTTVTATVDLP